uniref:ARAD1D43274p n=1 Tax=Blastobotrys adeninivorans TaxID=409370 RepID=A0A060TI36_BLAAD
MNLPVEIIYSIADYLPPQSLLNLSYSCKTLWSALESDHLWHRHLAALYAEAQCKQPPEASIRKDYQYQLHIDKCVRRNVDTFCSTHNDEMHKGMVQLCHIGPRARIELHRLLQNDSRSVRKYSRACLVSLTHTIALQEISALDCTSADQSFDLLLHLDAFYKPGYANMTEQTILEPIESLIEVVSRVSSDHSPAALLDALSKSLAQLTNPIIRPNLRALHNHIGAEEIINPGLGARCFLSGIVFDGIPGLDVVVACIYSRLAQRLYGINALPYIYNGEQAVVVANGNLVDINQGGRVKPLANEHEGKLTPLSVQTLSEKIVSHVTGVSTKGQRLFGLEMARDCLASPAALGCPLKMDLEHAVAGRLLTDMSLSEPHTQLTGIWPLA